MTIYAQHSFQIWPSATVFAKRVTSTGTDDHWIKFEHEGHNFSQFLIVGATVEEIDAIVAAMMRPIKRVKAERVAEPEVAQATE